MPSPPNRFRVPIERVFRDRISEFGLAVDRGHHKERENPHYSRRYNLFYGIHLSTKTWAKGAIIRAAKRNAAVLLKSSRNKSRFKMMKVQILFKLLKMDLEGKRKRNFGEGSR